MSYVEEYYVFEAISDPEFHLNYHGDATSRDSQSVIKGDTPLQLMENLRESVREVEFLDLFDRYQITKIIRTSVSSRPNLPPKLQRHMSAMSVAKKALDQYPGLQHSYSLASEFVAYSRRGGPSGNKYHIAIYVDVDDLSGYVASLDREERKQLVGVYDYWDDEKLVTRLLKPLGIRFPDCKYGTESGVVYFKNKSQPMMFRLKYGFDLEVFDFAEIYTKVTA